MKRTLLLIFGLIMLSSIVVATSNLYISLTLDYANGKLSKRDVRLVQSEELLDFSKKIGEYKAVAVSFNGDILFETYFDITSQVLPEPLKEWFDEKGNQIVIPEKGVDTQLKDVSAVVFIPYFKNVQSIKIYDKNDILKLSVDISYIATCNMNKICDLKESNKLCPEDCPYPEENIKLSWWQMILRFLKSLFK